MATWLDLKAYVGADGTGDDAYLQDCWNQATELVTRYVGTSVVPVPIIDRAVLEVGHELFNRRNAPSGSSQFAVFDGGTQPVRGPRDPMAMVYPMLGRWVVGF